MTDDRDRSIEALLRQRRQDDADLRASEECVDAELLAAWVDGSLSRAALADAERHAAGCARCQTLLASMAKTSPAIDTRPWWRTVTAKWLVPVAAVATGLVVWVLVEQTPQESASRPTSLPAAPVETSRATEPVPLPRQDAQQVLDSRAKAAANEPKAAANELKKERSADKTADQARPLDAVGQAAGGLAADALASQPARRETDSAARPAPSAVAALPAPAPPLPAAPVAPAPQLRAPAAASPVAETVTVTSEAASKQVAAGRGGGGGRAFMSGPEIRSPQSEYRWRIVPPSGIQRSVDAGVTWAVVDPVPGPAVAGGVSAMVLTTGSSPSRDVCWIVGRAGIVLVTADGATWQRRTLPEAVDLVAVRATDARTATVTTADGRQFATTDAGITWTAARERPDLGQE